MGRVLEKWKSQTWLQKMSGLIGLCVIAGGIAVSIYMNFVGRSLWVDEAMLAYSFSERSFFELTSAPFEWLQSAPVLYLYFVKLMTLVFGNTEFVLRSFSVLSYIVTLGLTFYAAKHIFKVRYAVLCTAFLANMNFMLKYSNVFKQYMSECVWVLLVLIVYYLYQEGKISFRLMPVLYMVFLWGANPACFFIGGVLAYELAAGLWKKNRIRVRNSLLAGAGVAASFVIYYFYWLRGVAASEEMQSYWAGAVFPLIPRSIADLKEAQALLYDIFIVFREGRVLVMGLVLAAFLIGVLRERSRYFTVMALGFVLCLFASFLKMFPVADRMWCFAYPLFAILAFAAVDRMIQDKNPSGELTAVILMVVLIGAGNGILVYRHSEHVFWDGEEANFPIAYVQEHIEEDESAFVYYHSIPVVKYKIGYDTSRIGDTDRDNIIWTAGTANDSGHLEEDVSRIEAAGKCYIIASHTTPDRFGPLLNALQEKGNLELVQNEHSTPLYFFAAEGKDSKAKVEYEVVSFENEEDTCYVTIRVKNTGDAYINTEYDNVAVACRQREDIRTNLWSNLAPGAYFDMPLSFQWKGDTSVDIQLCNEGRYWYDELGFEPVTVTKDMTLE